MLRKNRGGEKSKAIQLLTGKLNAHTFSLQQAASLVSASGICECLKCCPLFLRTDDTILSVDWEKWNVIFYGSYIKGKYFCVSKEILKTSQWKI